MEDVGGGGEEGEEEEDETHLGALGACFEDGNRGTLKSREGGGLLLYLHLGLMELGYDLLEQQRGQDS